MIVPIHYTAADRVRLDPIKTTRVMSTYLYTYYTRTMVYFIHRKNLRGKLFSYARDRFMRHGYVFFSKQTTLAHGISPIII